MARRILIGLGLFVALLGALSHKLDLVTVGILAAGVAVFGLNGNGGRKF